MQSKIHTYENDDITITYDVNRCIHAAECVKGLRKVFDPNKRPWIQPEHASVDELTEIVQRCPTGALHFQEKGSNSVEPIPDVNSISFTNDGPIFLRGDVVIKNNQGEKIVEDTRVSICRCGQSSNKPLCDNSHKEIDFEAPTAFRTDKLTKTEHANLSGKLEVEVMEKGPYIVKSEALLYSDTMQPRACSGNIALCRCGGSKNKPFCDGTHKSINFEG